MPPADHDASPAPSTDPTPGQDTPATADNQAPAPSSPGDNAATSPDAPTDDRSALLKVARDVVEAKPKIPEGEGQSAASDDTDGADKTASPTPPADPALEADPTEDELKAATPKTRARIEKLLSQRADARRETETLKPDAEKWQQMHGYLTRHDLAAEDVNLLLGVGAALRRGDFKSFLDGVKPYVDLAQQALGEALPADIQAKVDQGELSEAAARELSVARIQNSRLQSTVQANDRAREQQVRQAADTEAAQARQAAVTDWERNIQARDPDYAKAAPLVLRISQALIQEQGLPRTPEDAVAMAQRAYTEAKQMYAQTRPPLTPTRPQPSGARSLNGARPEPKSLMEAAMMGLEQSRARH